MPFISRTATLLLILGALLTFVGCAADSGEAASSARSPDFSDNGGGKSDDDNNNTPDNNTNIPGNNTPAPEPEERFNFQAPQPSRNYVFVANTELDTVARIDGDTLEITSIEVGDEPTIVRTSQRQDVAAVLNQGSNDVSIIHASPQGNDVITLPIREGFNQVVVSPNGEYALAYLDYAEYEQGDDLGRFQDVNLIKLTQDEEEVFNIAVGFRVLEVEFDQDSERAFVITEDGISILRLDEIDRDTRSEPIPVSDDPFEDALAVDREVEITNDGSTALVRSSVLEGLNIVDLGDRRNLMHLPMNSVPTDLDIYPDSSRAVVVLKEAREVGVLDLTEELSEENLTRIDIPEGPLGLAAVDADADFALLYSIAEQSPQITRLDLNTGDQILWDVRKALQGVSISPGGNRALLFHSNQETPRSDEASDVYIANSHAYTMLDLSTGFTKLQTAPTEPGEFVFDENNEWMFLVLNEPGRDIRQIDRIHLNSFRVDHYRLGSPPEHIGLLPSNTLTRVYVSQKHPVGRMTFIDIETGDSKTVTGYELNSQIR